ncbi:hypothetical protein ILUMI_18841 [Ignelater luminosus]|uniref:PiggyBac transposable element-derived protein domain-containing protein n=1 Tax=Ignelater luminosus TaxID=2038154 RepID=A0A8K0CNF6_IGNLU|nr:hypothetical protein ILUMI_18841 [Ignelater luminosus]
MWPRKGFTPEQALSYLDELEGLLESNSKHEGESTSNSENEAYSRVLRKSSESNSTSDIQASDTTPENSLCVASCSYKTSDVKRSNSSDLTVTKNKPQRILCHRNVQSNSNLIQKKKREFLLEENQTCTSKDGTKWKVVYANEIRAVKTAQRNILKDNPGSTFYAKQKTNKDKICTFWRLFVDNHMLKIIKNCTETETNNKLENVDWKLSFEDLDAFIAILYARRAYASSKLELYGKNITVNDQLFPTKVICRFTQYMPNKPDKFGIKPWIAVDTKSKYVLNAFSYLGKDETRPQDQTLSKNVVLQLLQPFTKKGRNVTTDNYFTSVKLAEKLIKLNTTIVGTMNRSRRGVLELGKSSREDLYETGLLKTDNDNYILTIYQAKPNKNKKPETVPYYSDTKYGVDVPDQMARKYTVNASSRRWPVHIFYNILDLAAINAYILYKEITGKKIKRRNFLLQLAEQLAEEYKNKEAVKEGTSQKKRRDRQDLNLNLKK